ncbi:MAG: DUF2147 domain-containing protein [Hyphomicrobiales bacterium]
MLRGTWHHAMNMDAGNGTVVEQSHMKDWGFNRCRSLKRLIAICAVAALQIMAWAGCASADSTRILGEWLTEDKVSRIALVECDDAICGDIVWIAEDRANNEQGQPVTDRNNPDPALRDRTILGLRIFHDLKPSEDDDNTWVGEVYNPENGEVYKTFVTPQRSGKLQVKGCILRGWVCKSEYWTRPDAVKPETDENVR